MAERSSDRWVSVVLSVLLHGSLAALVIYGFWTYKQSRPPAPTLAIEATVVDSRTVKGALQSAPPQPEPPPPAPTPAPQPEAPPPETVPPEPTGPPEPTPEELAQREQAQKEEAEKAQQAQAEKEQAEAAEKQRQLDQQKQQEDAQRQADLERQRKEQEKADAERKAAEAKKRAEEQRQAEQKKAEEQAQREADERAKQDLQNSLAAEEHTNAVRNSGALTSWVSQITARIQRAWLRPPSARSGVQCVLHVTQAPGGTVTNVKIGECNADAAVRESIEAAVYRASPLPPPPDPSLFERDLEITFRPD